MSGTQRGRPRSARAHGAILETARDLLGSVGYEQMTMEAIAAGAGVGKQTVYRWWPSKAAVVAEAVLSGYLDTSGGVPPDSGDVEADLRAWLDRQFQRMDDAASVAMVRGLAAAAADSAADAERLYGELTGPSRDHLIRRMAAGVERGQIRADADLDAAADAVIGTLLYRALAGRPPTGYRSAEGLLDLLFAGLAHPARRQASREVADGPGERG
ncbi:MULTISPECIES: TetR/AcrR family transcriptional regulator [Nocardia]|uniref:TetR/AcrR family transcriptional regulator n=1 Tax=Nocardia TaxID=1817 RepID=UPI000D69A638|nr:MULTISPECIES: TetR/AcrR family transcriptional regulator [Nocardia]